MLHLKSQDFVELVTDLLAGKVHLYSFLSFPNGDGMVSLPAVTNAHYRIDQRQERQPLCRSTDVHKGSGFLAGAARDE